jgi:hypothetical protein
MKTYSCNKVIVWFTCLTLLFLSVIAAASLTFAEEMRFFIPSYEGEELAKVREWEKQWAGKKVDQTNVDQIKDFLLPSQHKIVKDPQYLNDDSWWFDVVPYKTAELSRGQMEMTKKYAPTAKVGEEEMLENYEDMAGFIFPDPKTGVEVAYNFDMLTKGDSRYERTCGSVIEPRVGCYREQCRNRWEMFWVSRCFGDTIPKLPKNPKKFRRTLFSRVTSPPDFVDQGILEIKYAYNRESDMWFWMPRYRRIRRVERAARGDNIDGTELIRDDTDGWYDSIRSNTYELVGRKELLLVRRLNNPAETVVRKKGSACLNGFKRERLNTYVVEVKSKDPNYTYSKQLWYVDPEQWMILIKQCWDEEGRLWRINEYCYQEVQSIDGQPAFIPAAGLSIDVYGRHASFNIVQKNKDVGKTFKKGIFTINNLQKFAY